MKKSNPILVSNIKIKEMFKQVSNNIRQLLQNLNYIYDSHGVDYSVDTYYPTIFRLLYPVELLSQSNQGTKDLTQEKKVKTLNPEIFAPTTKKTYFHSQYEISQQPTEHQPIAHLEPFEKYSDNYKKQPANEGRQISFRYSRTSLSAEEQLKICEWMKEQIKYGNLVTKNDIGYQAKMISRHKNFQASSGWFRRFLNRHEDARLLLEVNKQASETNTRRIDSDTHMRKRKRQNTFQRANVTNPPSESDVDSVEWEAIVKNGEVGSNEKEEQNEDFMQEEISESPRFSRVVTRLEGAVKGHRESMYTLNLDDPVQNLRRRDS